jgi:hypothetical protein
MRRVELDLSLTDKAMDEAVNRLTFALTGSMLDAMESKTIDLSPETFWEKLYQNIREPRIKEGPISDVGRALKEIVKNHAEFQALRAANSLQPEEKTETSQARSRAELETQPGGHASPSRVSSASVISTARGDATANDPAGESSQQLDRNDLPSSRVGSEGRDFD